MLRLIGDLELDRLAFDKSRPANGIKRRVSEIAKHYRQEVARLQALREDGHVGRLELNAWDGGLRVVVEERTPGIEVCEVEHIELQDVPA